MTEYKYYVVTREHLAEIGAGHGESRKNAEQTVLANGDIGEELVVLFAAEVPTILGPEPTLPLKDRGAA